jgi:hypothetical protein
MHVGIISTPARRQEAVMEECHLQSANVSSTSNGAAPIPAWRAQVLGFARAQRLGRRDGDGDTPSQPTLHGIGHAFLKNEGMGYGVTAHQHLVSKRKARSWRQTVSADPSAMKWPAQSLFSDSEIAREPRWRPIDTPSYSAQLQYRSNLAIDRNSLTPLMLNPATALADGRQCALATGLDP